MRSTAACVCAAACACCALFLFSYQCMDLRRALQGALPGQVHRALVL